MAIVAIFTLLSALVVSMIVVRVATIALVLTGVSREVARFQARSAFTSSGFTSQETEMVMQHPVRRRIISILMLWGNVGMVTVISALILSFAGLNTTERDVTQEVAARLTILGLGLFLLWTFATSEWIDRWLSKVITWALTRFTDLRVHDYLQLLRLSGGYAVARLHVAADSALAGKSLMELRLLDQGVLVLGIERVTGEYIGAPTGENRVQAEDTLLAYGPDDVLGQLEIT